MRTPNIGCVAILLSLLLLNGCGKSENVPALKKKIENLTEENTVLKTESEIAAQKLSATETAKNQSNQKDSCVANLRLIDAAKQLWAIEHRKPFQSIAEQTDIAAYLTEFPSCPAGGHYEIRAVNEMPRCSVGDHQMLPSDVRIVSRALTQTVQPIAQRAAPAPRPTPISGADRYGMPIPVAPYGAIAKQQAIARQQPTTPSQPARDLFVSAYDLSKGGALALAQAKLPPGAQVIRTKFNSPTPYHRDTVNSGQWGCYLYYK